MTALTHYRTSPTEAAMEQAIREAVEFRGGRCWSVRDSRGMAVDDMPDLIIVAPFLSPGAVIFAELKSTARRVTSGQEHALSLLAECQRVESMIVRPDPKPGEIAYDDVIRWLEAS